MLLVNASHWLNPGAKLRHRKVTWNKGVNTERKMNWRNFEIYRNGHNLPGYLLINSYALAFNSVTRIFQIKKLRLTEFKKLAKNHTATERQN